MALGIGYGLPFYPHFGSGADPYKPLWNEALEGAKGAGATVEDEGGTCLVARGSEVYNGGLPSTPSLLIVPQFYKDGNLYQDVPPFVAEDSTMRFTVSRNTTATRVNSSGLIESVASGVPRIDWLGQSCPGLLVEPSAQNQALWSRDLSVSGTWTASGITAVRNAVGADGAASGATTLTATAASATITQNILHVLQSRIFSAYMRRVSGSGQIQLTTNGGINWQTVTLTSAFAPFNSGTQTVVSGQVGIRMIASGDVIEVDFTQAEVGPVPTSPITTTTAAVSRAADVISTSGALVSGLIGQTEGTIYAEVDVRALGAAKNIMQIDEGASTNRIGLFVDISPTRLTLLMSNGGVTNSISGSLTTGITKIAASYSSGNVQVFTNGSFLVSGTIATYPTATLNSISVGSRISSGVYGIQLNDRIRAAALYTTRLSNDQLAELTRL